MSYYLFFNALIKNKISKNNHYILFFSDLVSNFKEKLNLLVLARLNKSLMQKGASYYKPIFVKV